MNSKDRVVIITGAAGGVGKAITKRLVYEGNKVVLVGRAVSKLSKVITEIGSEYKKNLLPIKADITNEAEVLGAIEQTISAFNKVDILINNAGILNDPTPFHLMADDQWMSLINTNLIGTFRMTKAVIPIMMEKAKVALLTSHLYLECEQFQMCHCLSME